MTPPDDQMCQEQDPPALDTQAPPPAGNQNMPHNHGPQQGQGHISGAQQHVDQDQDDADQQSNDDLEFLGEAGPAVTMHQKLAGFASMYLSYPTWGTSFSSGRVVQTTLLESLPSNNGSNEYLHTLFTFYGGKYRDGTPEELSLFALCLRIASECGFHPDPRMNNKRVNLDRLKALSSKYDAVRVGKKVHNVFEDFTYNQLIPTQGPFHAPPQPFNQPPPGGAPPSRGRGRGGAGRGRGNQY